MAQKKCNHYIPRCILKHWETFDSNRFGVHTFDVSKDKKYFANTRGNSCSAYKFAVSNYIYVPEIDGERRYNLEDWFSLIEGTLATTVKKLSEEINTPLFSKSEDVTNLLLSILSLKHRTKFEIEVIKNFLKTNPEYRKRISGYDNRKLELIVLENIINATYEELYGYSGFELSIGRSNSESLIMSDRPYFHELFDGFSFLPITNRKFIALKKSDKEPSFSYVDVDDNMISALNEAIASNARYWIIADSPELIDKYQRIAKEENLESNVEYHRINHLDKGFLIE